MPVTHIMLGAKDKAKSVAFYEAALAPVGYKKMMEQETRAIFSCGEGQPPVIVGKPYEGEASFGNGTMIGFAAESRAKVRDAYEAGLKSGGKDDGKPGPRPNGPPNTYAAYLRDPAGNKIGFFCMKPGE
jgi:catechol 2,3-dioxygenase-like lactoylglutathione lyase family enzyme